MSPNHLQARDLPPWYEPGQFVITGYRNPRYHSTLATAAASAFAWHNETLNIHTHLLTGLAGFAILYYRLQEPFYLNGSDFVKFFSVVQALSVIIMGFTSAFAHTFYVISPAWYALSWKVDVIGIISVTYSHLLADHYLLFSVVSPAPILFYTSMGACTAFMVYSAYNVFTSDGKNIGIWGVYCGGLASIPYTAAVAWYAATSEDPILRETGTASILCSICCIIAGGIFFTGKIPERFIQSRWIDYGFHSHVWHHIFISLSIYLGGQGIPHLR